MAAVEVMALWRRCWLGQLKDDGEIGVVVGAAIAADDAVVVVGVKDAADTDDEDTVV